MDNLLQISQKVNTDIDPNGAPESILAQNHNDILQMFLRASGKYMGLPYIIKTNYQGVISPGELFVSGAFNTTITAFISPKTTDGTDTQPILNIYKNGDFFHLKDFAGRSVYFTITNILDTIDNNSNQVFALTLEPFPSNINYSYQNAEQQVGVVELIKSTDATKNFFQDVELNLFWNGRGFTSEQPFSEYGKLIKRKKFVSKDTGGNPYFKTIKTKVLFLGVEVKGFSNISNFEPEIVIERYKRTHLNKKNNFDDPYYRSPSKYRSTNFYWDNVGMVPVYNENTGMVDMNSVERPMLIPIVSEKKYYDIKAENYFSQVDPPKALGNQHFVTFPKPATATIEDDSNTYSRKIPRKQKGYTHLRLRIRIKIANDVYLYSPIMSHLKIIDLMNWTDGLPASELNVIKYSYE
jgi:hypothetical protein